MYHTESPDPIRPIKSKVRQNTVNILPSERPNIEKTEPDSESRNDENMSVSHNIGIVDTKLTLDDKKDPVTTPTLVISEQMPYLTICDDNITE